MFFISYASGILGLVGLLTGGVLLVRQYGRPLARYLACFTLCAGMWAFANAGADLSPNPSAVVFWSGCAFISFNFFASFFLCFVLSFTRHDVVVALRWQIAALLPAFVLGVFAFSRYSILEVILLPGIPAQILPGPLYVIGPIFLYGAFIFSYILIALRYRSFSPVEKLQVRSIVAGSVAALVGLTIFDIILPLRGELRFFTVGPMTTAVLIAVTAHAIFRHGLAGLNQVIRRSVIYTTLIIIVTAFYTGLILALTALFHPSHGEAIAASAGITVFVGLLGAPWMERLFQKRAAELERRVRERTAELAHLHESQAQMMLELSHGLQTPLTVMRNELDLVEEQVADKKNIRAFRHSLDGLSRFVYDLLRLARSERVAPSAAAALDARILLEEVVEYVEVLARASGVSVNAELQAGVYVAISPSELEEVVTNLLANALRHTRSSPRKVIRLFLEADGDRMILRIEDTGSGISAEDLARVFEKFYRPSGTAEAYKEGAGLGLAICQRIITMRGGSIRAESVLGVGTTFTVELPRVLQDVAEEAGGFRRENRNNDNADS